MPVSPSKEFPGFGFEYDSASQPFFKAMIKENLRKIALLPTGKALLKYISELTPIYRAPQMPSGVNVVISPPLDKKLLAPGVSNQSVIVGTTRQTTAVVKDQAAYDDWYSGKKGQLVPSYTAKTLASEHSKPHAFLTGGGWSSGGCTCSVNYSNIEILAKDGTWLPPHIVLGHELIHCFHFLSGVGNSDFKAEEHMTVGIKGYEKLPITENNLRRDAGMPVRKKYFPDD